MALDIDIDFGLPGFDDLGDMAKDTLVDFATDMGIDKLLRKYNKEDTPTDTRGKKERADVTPDFWVENKKWIIPAGIGTGVLAVLGIAMAATKKKK